MDYPPCPRATPLPPTAPTSGCCDYCVSSGRIHLPFQADVHATSLSVMGKAKVMSRAGNLCGAGQLYPQKEPLPGAEVTTVARNTDAFSRWSIADTANYRANPKYFYFEPLHP